MPLSYTTRNPKIGLQVECLRPVLKSTTFDAEVQGAWTEKVEGDNTKTGKDISITGNTITAVGEPINLN